VLYLIPLLPFVGFLVNTAFRRVLPKGISGAVATGAMALSFGWSLASVWRLLGSEPTGGVRAISESLYTWFASGSLDVPLAFRLDPLSSVMVLFVTFVGFLIHVYSIGYMGHDPGYARYMAYLNLFMFAMLTLVLGANYAVLFVGWEGVGLCSYLLIGFWFHKQSASDAGITALLQQLLLKGTARRSALECTPPKLVASRTRVSAPRKRSARARVPRSKLTTLPKASICRLAIA